MATRGEATVPRWPRSIPSRAISPSLKSGTRGYRITDIFTTITTGVKGTGMAAFDFIVPADRMALVHYVRSLGSFDHGAEDPKATEALAEQFRSKGVHIPNRIPVSMAIKKMVQEREAGTGAQVAGRATTSRQRRNCCAR